MVGRCRLTLLCPRTDPACLLSSNRKYHGPVSNFAFNCNLRPSNMVHATMSLIVMVGWSRLTPGGPEVDPACLQRLKPTRDKLLSNVAFNFNLRHYSMAIATIVILSFFWQRCMVGRCSLTLGLHTSPRACFHGGAG